MKHLVIGYHGGSLESVEKLSKGQFDLEKSDPNGWLGPGLYFWEQDERRAWRWVKSQPSNDRAVLKAQINLTHNTVDLTTRKTIYDYREFIKKVMSKNGFRKRLEQSLARNEIGRVYKDDLWLRLYRHAYEKTSCHNRIHAFRAVVLTGDNAYSDYDVNGENSLTAYTAPENSEVRVGSRVVTRMNIVIALLSKIPIEKSEVLLEAPSGEA